jgi:hypothetical protein
VTFTAFASTLYSLPLLAAYPVQAVWSEFVQFCQAEGTIAPGWTEYQPKPNTPLAFFAEGASPFGDRVKPPVSTVYRKTVAGRAIYAMKRVIGVRTPASEYCQAFDFSMTERLAIEKWQTVLGTFLTVNQTEFEQSFRYERDASSARSLSGAINLHQSGYFVPLDAIGFTGLQLTAISKDSE